MMNCSLSKSDCLVLGLKKFHSEGLGKWQLAKPTLYKGDIIPFTNSFYIAMCVLSEEIEKVKSWPSP